MKFILELLTERGQTVVCGNRGEAITRLDSYPDHRPGQPIAAVYIKDGERKALLALGHDYGIGLEGSKRKYTVIGDVDATNSVTTTVTADQIKLREIDYSGLLDDIQEKVKEHLGVDSHDFHRFGWLGTVNDPWLSTLKVPNGASVQDAFDAILLGRLDHGGGDEDPTLNLTANPTYIEITATEQKTYTVTANATYNGSLTAASMTVTNGTAPTNFFDRMRDYKSWSGTYTVTAQTLGLVNPGDEITISYNATITANGKTATGSSSVRIKLIGDQPTPPGPGERYKIIYTPYNNTGSPQERVYAEQSLPVSLLQSIPSNFDWTIPANRTLDGWSFEPDGEKITRTLNIGDFSEETDPTDNTHFVRVYPIWKYIPTTSKLILRIPICELDYNGSDQKYTNACINQITVEDSNGNLLTEGIDYQLVWSPSQQDIQDETKHKDAGTYNSSDGLRALPLKDQYDPSDPGHLTLIIHKIDADIIVLIDGEPTQNYRPGEHTAPVETFTAEQFANGHGFYPEDYAVVTSLTNWGSWIPTTPDMVTTGEYTLSFLESVLPSDPNIRNNYRIHCYPATLIIQDEPLTVTFTTFGYTNEPAVHQPDLSGTSFIHNTAGANGLTGDLNDWWLFDSYRKNQANHTTYIYSSKPITSRPEIKRWDSATSQWIIPTAELNNFTWSGNTVTFEHFNDIAEVWDTEHSLYAIKFN